MTHVVIMNVAITDYYYNLNQAGNPAWNQIKIASWNQAWTINSIKI
jgi:hypothetical protein